MRCPKCNADHWYLKGEKCHCIVCSQEWYRPAVNWSVGGVFIAQLPVYVESVSLFHELDELPLDKNSALPLEMEGVSGMNMAKRHSVSSQI